MHQKRRIFARKKLSADVTLGLDFDKIGQKLRKLEKCQIRRDSMQNRSISEVQVCKDYNYIANTFGISDGLKLVGASEGRRRGKGKVGMTGARGGSSSGTEIDMRCFFYD